MTAPLGGTAPYCVQPPSVSRIAGPNSTSPDTRSTTKWRSNSVEPTKSLRGSQRAQSPDSGSWTSSVSPEPSLRIRWVRRPGAELEDWLVAGGVGLAGRAVRDADDLAVDARGVRGRQAGAHRRRGDRVD